MDVYSTEEEQIAYLKRLWKQYGMSTLLAIAVGLGLGFGWQYWRRSNTHYHEEASRLYETMLLAANNQNAALETQLGQTLIDQYHRAPYAVQAKLLLARKAVNAQDLPAASQALSWVIQHAKSPSMRQIARNRYARVLLSQHHPKQALNILETVDDSQFVASTLAIKGDIYVALRDIPKAKLAYAKALKALPNGPESRPVLQMKYSQLG